MRTRTVFATLAIPATAMGLFAQQNELQAQEKALKEQAEMLAHKTSDRLVIAQGAVGVMALSGEPGNFQYFTQGVIFNGRPVTGAPYSADEKTESVQTLADGNRIVNTTTVRVYRDSYGRTRREMTIPEMGGETKPRTMITITDPVDGLSLTLDAQNKTAHKMPMPGMPVSGDAKMRQAELKMVTEANMTTGPGYRVVRRGALTEPKHEDLGNSLIEGVSVEGTRETSTIEANAMGNEREITITSERWFSPDLKVEVKSVHKDPRTGETTHTLTNISRAEPDSSLFRAPGDYKLDEGKPGMQVHKIEVHE
jgi:hypothetical protein